MLSRKDAVAKMMPEAEAKGHPFHRSIPEMSFSHYGFANLDPAGNTPSLAPRMLTIAHFLFFSVVAFLCLCQSGTHIWLWAVELSVPGTRRFWIILVVFWSSHKQFTSDAEADSDPTLTSFMHSISFNCMLHHYLILFACLTT